jgi:hypothetical protein
MSAQRAYIGFKGVWWCILLVTRLSITYSYVCCLGWRTRDSVQLLLKLLAFFYSLDHFHLGLQRLNYITLFLGQFRLFLDHSLLFNKDLFSFLTS